jgi:hypothetical protein
MLEIKEASSSFGYTVFDRQYIEKPAPIKKKTWKRI